jgi:tetratricopeptide (TPR) repeat protein
MLSKLDIGIRHILPIYPFLIVLTAGGAWLLMQQSRVWSYIVLALLCIHVLSSVKSFPDYLPYSNEIAGGPSNTYKLLADSNAGWEGGIKGVQAYLREHNVNHCWFAYDGPIDLNYYHIPCSPLPTLMASMFPGARFAAVDQIDGPVFLSELVLTGLDDGPGPFNAYDEFTRRTPDAVVQGEVLVYNGTFKLPKVSARSHFAAAMGQFYSGKLEGAIAEARAAQVLDPDFLYPHELLSYAYARTGKKEEARKEYQAAMELYRTKYASFSKRVPQNPLESN